MARRPVIRVIGSLNIDFVTRTPRVPGPGETLSATSMTVHPGGKGSNQAVACGKAAFTSPSSQDVVVEMIGAVGANDPYYASLLKPTLEKSGVSTTGVEEMEGVQTGTATIVVDEGSHGENRILVVPGANARVNDLAKVMETVTKDGIPDVVVMQGEIPRSTVLGLLRAFNSPEYKTCVIFNPAPMFPEGIPIDALKGLAVLVVNETECRQLFACVDELKTVPTSGLDEPMTELELNRLTTYLHNKAGILIVVVTLGSHGVYYSFETSDFLDRSLIPAVKVERVVDTTGAGDTFVGYFATAVARHLAQVKGLENLSVREAVVRANEAAAKCVQRNGAMESIPFGYE
ncbi:ribokinase [Cladophialophora bantiana CBS 173.52]|uniref:Ribokinase n=1 Tax=Cladophialophora bantiana (strain ATCC 10958 / CBS 173.52 / CDC B-1940 / NIH 8579) TaxID=1442370 RepID=A0A0D2G1Q7_CLAB1|nr:ribokinase [Cladophialophora bantiana CBS 173.52]KIW92672.1 ribokinase [Cladophialophora bantiana CBS 173.52]